MESEDTQVAALFIMKHLTDTLYSLNTIQEIYSSLPVLRGPPRDGFRIALLKILAKAETHGFNQKDLLNLFRFYIKGSSATVLLDEASNIGSSQRVFPYSIDSDIDAQLLINPYLLNELMFKILRFKLMEKLLEALFNILIGEHSDRDSFNLTFEAIQSELARRFGTAPTTFKRTQVIPGEAPEDTPGSVNLLRRFNNRPIPDNCPFNLRIYQNYGYTAAGRIVPLNFTLIRVYIPVPNSTQIIEVLDITIPFYSLQGNSKAWILSSDVGKTEFGFVQGPVGHYVNQSLTNRKMSRTGRENARKVTRRRRRIQKIKEKIYKPHRGRLQRSLNTIRKGLRGMAENEPLVAEILEELVAP